MTEEELLQKYKTIKTAFYFLDETGLLRKQTDPYFALGVLICPKPQELYQKIRKIRDRYKYYWEIKWGGKGGMSKIKCEIAKEILESFLNTLGAKFSCMILRKKELDFNTHFGGDFWNVYSSFTVALLKLNLRTSNPPVRGEDIICLISDNYFSPPNRDIESRIKDIVNDHYKELRVMGVCQMDSKSCDLLQIADLFLGAVLYDLKVFEKIIPLRKNYKMKFLNYLHYKLRVRGSFFQKGRNFVKDNFKITIFDPTRSRAQMKTKTGQGPQRSSPVI